MPFMSKIRSVGTLAAKTFSGLSRILAPKPPYWANLPMTDDLERELNNRYWRR